MASTADLAEAVGDVIGTLGPGEIGLVTSVARIRRVDVAGGVTSNTLLRHVGAGQSKARGIVVKGGRSPGRGSVAATAEVAKIIGDMARVGCPCKVGLMT